jgi:hypothetical protein
MMRGTLPTTMNASDQITRHIADLGDWRGKVLTQLRTLVREAAPDAIEEWKWNTRAIDIHEGDRINATALKDLIRAAVAMNGGSVKPAKSRKR